MKTSKLFDIKNKVIVITGGSGFLGGHYVQFLKEAGAIAINIDIKEDHSVDLLDELSIQNIVNEIIKDYGRIDVLINNASFNIHIDQQSIKKIKKVDYFAPFEEYELEAYKRSISVDLIGSFITSKTILPYMKRQKNGSIINISSIYGMTAPDQRLYEGIKNPQRPNEDIIKPPYYTVAKSGLWGLTLYLASYARPHIRVNMLTLGGIQNQESTDFVKRYSQKAIMGRMGHPEDIYGPLLLLGSNASSYMTGQNIIVDGGFTAW